MIEILLTGRGPNTMSLESLARFEAALIDAGDEPLLITGAGDAFSAGLDLDALERDDPEALLARMEAVVERLFLYPAPTVACVNGHAIAGGCLLAIACDHRVVSAAPSVRLGMTAVALGLTYPPLVLAVLRARLPPPSLERVLLGGGRVGPADALALGIVDELAEDPGPVARARLAALAAHPRLAYAETKRALRASAIVVSDAERARFRERALPAWDADALRARLDRIRGR